MSDQPDVDDGRHADRAGVVPTMSAGGRAPALQPAEPPPERIGLYRIREQIGEGGMGIVYLAEQTEPVRRRVALKLIKLGMDSKVVVARFETERQALAMMDHPNVAKVFDAGTAEDGRPYFVMEYVAGVPLTTHCDLHRLGIRERLDLFVQVCTAVHHAHRKGIVHRDLKPSNVLVTFQDDEAVPKVIDFGVAKAMSHRLTERTLFTERGQLIGTPEYMSPEQAEMGAQGIDARSDVYSLGVMLYELLAGRLPFDRAKLRRAGFAEVVRIIRDEDPPKPSTQFSLLSHAPAEPTRLASPVPASDDVQPHSMPRRGAVAQTEVPVSPGDSAIEIAHLRCTEPHTLVRNLRGDLDWIVMKCLEKDRVRRYATAKGLAEDIRRYMAHMPIAAGPPTAIYRLRKLVRRNRSLMTSTLVASLAVLVMGALALGLRPDRALPRMPDHKPVSAAANGVEHTAAGATDLAATRPPSTAVPRVGPSGQTSTSLPSRAKAAPTVVLVVREDLNIADEQAPTTYGGISQEKYRRELEAHGIEIALLPTQELRPTIALCREAASRGADWVILGDTRAERMEPLHTDAVSGFRWKLTLSVQVYRAGDTIDTVFRDAAYPTALPLTTQAHFSRDALAKQASSFGRRLRERLLSRWREENQ